MRPGTPLLLWTIPLLLACASPHPLGADWQSLPVEARETRATETVRSVLAERGSKIPGRPGSEESQVLFVDRRLVVYRPCCAQSGAEVSAGNLAVLLFHDIQRLERRVVYDFPSQPEDLSIYLRWKSPSVWGVRAHSSILTPLLSRVGLEGPVLLLPQRPRETYRRLKAALEYLLTLPRPREGAGATVEEILRQAAEDDRDPPTFEAEVLAALGD